MDHSPSSVITYVLVDIEDVVYEAGGDRGGFTVRREREWDFLSRVLDAGTECDTPESMDKRGGMIHEPTF